MSMIKIGSLLVALCVMNSIGFSQESKLIVESGTYPSWSPNGNHIAYQARSADGNSDIYLVTEKGEEVQRLTSGNGNNLQPSWSPDGHYIAFVSDRDGDNEIYIMDANGKNQKRLTNHSNNDIHPKFSPDSEWILFNYGVGEGRDSRAELWKIRKDGSGLTKVFGGPEGLYTFASWSPDGQSILHVRWFMVPNQRRPNTEIFTMGNQGENSLQLTDSPTSDAYPTWSPDGSRICFASRKQENYRLYVINKDGTGEKDISDGSLEGNFVNPAWSPDGSKIMFVLNNGQKPSIYVMPMRR